MTVSRACSRNRRFSSATIVSAESFRPAFARRYASCASTEPVVVLVGPDHAAGRIKKLGVHLHAVAIAEERGMEHPVHAKLPREVSAAAGNPGCGDVVTVYLRARPTATR